jgi:hypothetical protein
VIVIKNQDFKIKCMTKCKKEIKEKDIKYVVIKAFESIDYEEYKPLK